MIDWKARAEREAAAVLDECGAMRAFSRNDLISVLAIAWLQGADFGTHQTLEHVDDAFDELRAAL